MATDKEIHKELEEISPVLSRLPKINPYTVPDGYFEQFPSTILAEARQAKVISIAPQRNTWRLAAAAVISGAILLGGWFFMQKRSSVDVLAPANVASVQTEMQQVSDTEMVAYVEGNGITPADDVSASGQISDEDVPLVLADVTDQELQQYEEQENSPANLN